MADFMADCVHRSDFNDSTKNLEMFEVSVDVYVYVYVDAAPAGPELRGLPAQLRSNSSCTLWPFGPRKRHDKYCDTIWTLNEILFSDIQCIKLLLRL